MRNMSVAVSNLRDFKGINLRYWQSGEICKWVWKIVKMWNFRGMA